MSIILATQKAEIRRIKVRSQPGEIVQEISISKNTQHKKVLMKWLKWTALV
jgi:hypothetical protein